MKLRSSEIRSTLTVDPSIADTARAWWAARDRATPVVNSAVAEHVAKNLTRLVAEGADRAVVEAALDHLLTARDAILDRVADRLTGRGEELDIRAEVARQIG